MTRAIIRTKRAIQALNSGTAVYREIPTRGLMLTHQKLYRVTHIKRFIVPHNPEPTYEVTFADPARAPQVVNARSVFIIDIGSTSTPLLKEATP
jgi:hypothetical protein